MNSAEQVEEEYSSFSRQIEYRLFYIQEHIYTCEVQNNNRKNRNFPNKN